MVITKLTYEGFCEVKCSDDQNNKKVNNDQTDKVYTTEEGPQPIK